MNVEIISYTQNPLETVAKAASVCYRSEPSLTIVKQCINSGHLSVLEHASFTFMISGVDRNCYDRKTEVLTKEGWKFLCDVKVGEKVLTINQDTLEAEFQDVINTISYKYNGVMHKYKSQNIDLLVTPNHNMFLKKYDVRIPDRFHLVPSEEIKNKRVYFSKIVNYNNIVDEYITIPGYSYEKKNNQGKTYVKTLSDLRLKRSNFYKLLAWYLSEGSTSYNSKENSYNISISQKKEKNINHIMNIINDCGFHCWYDGQAIHFKSLVLGKYFKNLGHSIDKKIPFNIFDSFNKELARSFIDEYILGDGSIDKSNCRKIYTISKEMANQLYTLCYIAGYTASYHIDNRVGQSHIVNGRTINNNYPCYVINISETGKRNYTPVIKTDTHRSEVNFNDYVYCVEVPNHTLFVRRNGVSCWCGNCTHQLVRHRIASYSQESQRYVDMSNNEFIYPEAYGRESTLYEKSFYHSMKCYEDLIELGAAKEDARSVLPGACETRIVVTMNLRVLAHFMNERLCMRAQEPIRKLANAMKQAVLNLFEKTEEKEIIRKLLVPKCEVGVLHFCPEAKTCNRHKTAKEINSILNSIKKEDE